MKLLDLSDHLPGLPRLPGLKKWYARDKVQYYETWEEASEVGLCQPKTSFIQRPSKQFALCSVQLAGPLCGWTTFLSSRFCLV